MENILGIITAIIVAIIITLFIFNKFNNKSKVSSDKQLDNGDSLPQLDNEDILQIELPWKIESFKSADLTLYRQPEPLTLTDNLKSHIGEVIKISPSAKDIVKSEKKVIVKFSEEVLEKIKSGELSIMKKKGSADQFRPIAIDNKNKINKHGWLEIKDIKKVNPAQLSNAVLGVMTVITAQEHLDKINKQLTVIDQKIDTLIRQYNNDKFGKIQGNIRYLKSILPSILNQDEKLQAYLIKIEDFSSTSYNEIESVLRELPFLINNASLIKEKAKFGLDKIVNEIKELTSSFEQKVLLGYGNLEVMSVCLKIINDLGNNSEVNINRLADIENYYKQLTEYSNQFENILKDKNLALDAIFRRNKTVNNKKEEIKKHLSYHYKTINNNMSAVNQHIVQLKSNDEDSIVGPVNLQIEYDAMDNIAAVYRLKQVN
ncbi:hypothetical protein D4T97_015620 [Siminovitchia acidinfaciens]|uniref:Uncharacterized protein n=1 Tax=Siminovitchia acidinfaciens TaxID=2321395 RepID=A0A429XVW1_9BACI|nr:hypothetical protein [Siminovitchia acidinfaciens]RST72489.1 hypothetical protein D4T97_015620 [Siminovitchia acidinfaciens]